MIRRIIRVITGIFQKAPDVSAEWLRGQTRAEYAKGYEGICWKWPIKKEQ